MIQNTCAWKVCAFLRHRGVRRWRRSVSEGGGYERGRTRCLEAWPQKTTPWGQSLRQHRTSLSCSCRVSFPRLTGAQASSVPSCARKDCFVRLRPKNVALKALNNSRLEKSLAGHKPWHTMLLRARSVQQRGGDMNSADVGYAPRWATRKRSFVSLSTRLAGFGFEL